MTSPTLKPSAGWQGDITRGAAMGRLDTHSEAPHVRRFYLQRVRLNSGGYDRGGAYWGRGQPLYWYESEDGEVSAFTRASDRQHAREIVAKRYPAARFFR